MTLKPQRMDANGARTTCAGLNDISSTFG